MCYIGASRVVFVSYPNQSWGENPCITHHENKSALFISIVCKSNEVVPAKGPLGLRIHNVLASIMRYAVLVGICWPLHSVFLLEAEDKIVVFCELRLNLCKYILSPGIVQAVTPKSFPFFELHFFGLLIVY